MTRTWPRRSGTPPASTVQRFRCPGLDAGPLGVWAISDYRMDPYVCNENEQFRQMWHHSDGCICIVDKHFSSFFTWPN